MPASPRPPRKAPETKKPASPKGRRVGRACRYCGKPMAVPPRYNPEFHPACLEQSITRLLNGIEAQADMLQKIGSLLIACFRAFGNVLEAKGLLSRDELRAAIAEVQVGDQVDDLLRDLGEPPSDPDAEKGRSPSRQ